MAQYSPSQRISALAACLVLAACGGHATVPAAPGSSEAGLLKTRAPQSAGLAEASTCYVTKQTPKTVQAMVTFYGYPDNSPPGRQIAHPVIHQLAGGDGTWCNPTTFATDKKDGNVAPYGIKIYVPYMKQYFIREDDCTTSGYQHLGCKGIWFDLWVGGTRNSNFKAVINCENTLTKNGKVAVILWPKAGLPVKLAGPIYRDNPPPNGTCFGKPGHG